MKETVSFRDQHKVSRRETIPESVKREVLLEAGFRCAVPTCRTILLLDLHHIVEVREDGPNEAHNLIALCPNCHALYHRQNIPKDAIRAWKNALIVLNAAFDRDALDDLLFLRKLQQNPLPISADGVLRFSKLIAADLVTFRVSLRGVGLYLMAPSRAAGNQSRPARYAVELTPKGEAFLEAWMKGDRALIQRALQNNVPARFVQEFTKSDWKEVEPGGFSISIAVEKHCKGASPVIHVYLVNADGTYTEPIISKTVDSIGNVSINSSCPFSGRVQIG